MAESKGNDSSSKNQKMKSFNIYPVGVKGPKPPEVDKSKVPKLKCSEEEKAAAEVYEEFLASFDEPVKHGKLFVRGTVINAGSGEEKPTVQTGKLYKPPKIAENIKKPEEKPETAKEKAERIERQNKKKEKEKKKSNLELFKEELRMIQEEREERHRLKNIVKEQVKVGRPVEPVETQIRLADDYRYPSYGSYDTGDPSTTNLYLGNLNPKMTEQQLCEVFGRFGPLASVKIMWPRSDEERARGRNCGFVAFMNRKDGERAMKNLNGKDIMSFEMKLGWGKAVPIPPHPIYIPPAMVEFTLPPPPSGLPFNAQLDKKDRHKLWPGEPETKESFEKLLANAVVKVVIPTERSLLCLIHRMIEFVVREGPMFEAMIMNREINNPMFRFLFDNQSPAHVYYRWRLYSILKGDHPSKWHTDEFLMFKEGSFWRPPPLNPFHLGMPEELVEVPPPPITRPIEPKKGSLSDTQREKFEDLLRGITPEKFKIADAMIYCIEHAEAAEEIIDCIGEAIATPEAPLYKKIGRLYLISDVLHNCSVKVANASFYRKGFQAKLPDIFKDLHETFQSIEGRLKAEQFKQRVVSCFRAWEDWAIYPSEFLIKLQNLFLGLVPLSRDMNEDSNSPQPGQMAPTDTEVQSSDDIDGVPLSVDDIDGVPLDGSLVEDRDDIDGVPLNDDLDGQPLEDIPQDMEDISSKFKPSKWETVDPETVEAQAITTSKWDLLEQNEEHEHVDDIDGQPMDDTASTVDDMSYQDEENSKDSSTIIEQLKTDINEERRAKLREVEVKVMKYQDELESGRRSRKPNMKFYEQVEHYRQKLLKRIERENKSDREGCEKHKRHKTHSPAIVEATLDSSDEADHSQSPSYYSSVRKISPRSVAFTPGDNIHSPHKSYRSYSPKKTRRSRSRSPKRSRRSRSKSPYKRRLSPDSPPARKHKSKKSRH
ncbi:U2 snRNP-associated SURP motif-containing protein [Parasteatoda tepidariorum]|uniref:U2 snRNP-associated SURP motif-containing protein n=1 Tax=Parasteatoda tepidariorum TaxID=114398 RepID=UPI00077FB5BB|nr:U2 snRNP-associated SURP motif-containing protein [Parasteatoda tepidariorum]XP_042894653.1 U2 snRNP-associated SURP motif-containing protein [Parasteatoda tepidariorum]